jgi:NTE family protein
VALSLSRRFDGLLDTAPLHDMVRRQISAENLRRSPVEFRACAVNIASGKAVYADAGYPDIVEYIIASTAIPLVMPITMIGGEPFWDGGIREVAPLKKAIELGASRIVCIACDPRDVGAVSIPSGKGPLSLLSSRLMDLAVNEILNNDIESCRSVNAHLEEFGKRGPLSDKRRIDLTVIRPRATLNVDLETFTPAQIAEMLEIGRTTAAETL